jgi:hypothetical protein
MRPEAVAKNLRTAIINASSERLGRSLTATETTLINQHSALIALESILDAIKNGNNEDLQKPLDISSAESAHLQR